MRRARALLGIAGWSARALIWSSTGQHELYGCADDPNQRVSCAASELARVAEMTRCLEARLAEQSGRPFHSSDEAAPERSAGFAGLDEETRGNLESLGYVN